MSVRTIIILITLILLQLQLISQNNIPADSLLKSFPAKNNIELNRLVNQLASAAPQSIIDMSNAFLNGQESALQAKYALSAVAKSMGKEHPAATQVETGFIQALDNDLPLDVRVFLIDQLQFFATESSLESLSGQILTLCEPAVNTITEIGSNQARDILLNAYPDMVGYCQLVVAKALSQFEGDKVVSIMQDLAGQQDANLKAIGLNFVAEHYVTESYDKLLAYASEDAEMGMDLLQTYCRSGITKGKGSQVIPAIEIIMNRAESEHDKLAGYDLWASAKPQEAENEFAKMFRKGDEQTQNLIASILQKHPSLSLDDYLKQIDKVASPSKIALLQAAKSRDYQKAASASESLIGSSDAQVSITALQTFSSLKKSQSLPQLQKTILTTSQESVRKVAISESFRWIDSTNMEWLHQTFNQSTGSAKIDLLQMIAKRGLTDFWDVVKPLLSSQDQAIRTAAYASLADLSGNVEIRELTTVAPLIANDFEKEQLRDAFAKQASRTEDRNAMAAPLLETFGKNGRKLLEVVLPAIGGSAALDYITQGTEPEPILAWRTPEGIHAQFDLLEKDPSDEAAYAAIIQLLRHPGLAQDQKLLHLRKLMTFAKDQRQKEQILAYLSGTKTHTSFRYVAQHLQDSTLQLPAAKALVSIALPPAGETYGLIGAEVKAVLMRVDTLLEETDDEYTRAFLHRYLDIIPEEGGFVSLFNGKDLSGWKALVGNPLTRDTMFDLQLQQLQRAANATLDKSWKVEDGKIIFFGDGYDNLCTEETYRDFELLLDWKIEKDGDSGIYLRGSPQIQIWDPNQEDTLIGSGGLFNNQVHPSKPLTLADNPVGEWNTFRIVMIDNEVTVYLNGVLVTDRVILENYWDRTMPIFREGQIELQAHTTPLQFRDLYIREITTTPELTIYEVRQGFRPLFNGVNLDGWVGNKVDYVAENGEIVIYPGATGGSGNLYTEKEYSDFKLRFEFKLTQGANNGLGIHAPLEGDAAYLGKEIQILDNTADIYADLKPYQYHGSVYGLVPADKGALKPIGEWNEQEVLVRGNLISVVLNGQRILYDDLDNATRSGTLDGKEHPGLKRLKGHIGFLGHGSEVHFRNIRIQDLSEEMNTEDQGKSE